VAAASVACEHQPSTDADRLPERDGYLAVLYGMGKTSRGVRAGSGHGLLRVALDAFVIDFVMPDDGPD
jgi:hypothetical protein